jgi:hypothetical protein
MIDSGDAKDVLVKVIDTEPKNRSWVLSLILNIILAIACFFCYSRMINAENRELELSKELDKQKSLNLLDNKDCLKAIREVEKNKDLEWSVKVDNLQTIYNKELKEKAEKLEQQIEEINKRVGR